MNKTIDIERSKINRGQVFVIDRVEHIRRNIDFANRHPEAFGCCDIQCFLSHEKAEINRALLEKKNIRIEDVMGKWLALQLFVNKVYMGKRYGPILNFQHSLTKTSSKYYG